jgi:hypothetical protein
LTYVPPAHVDTLVYHSDEIQVGGTRALDVAHSFGSLFHSEDGTFYKRGWHLPNHIHGHSELAYEDLQNGDNLHENNLFLVVKFHSVHDCAAHLNRRVWWAAGSCKIRWWWGMHMIAIAIAIYLLL